MNHDLEVAVSAVRRALLLQLGLLVLSALFLDFGETLRICCCWSLAFWVGATMVLVRRHSNPTRIDLVYVRWGLLILPFVAIPALVTVWLLNGTI
jgi:hypothetical protein